MSPLRRHFALVIALVALLGLVGWVLARNPTYEERDVVQERLDAATPPLDEGYTVGQTFCARRAGLKAVEVLLAVYEGYAAAPSESRLVLTLERLDASGSEPVRVSLPAGGLVHNERVRLGFAPLWDSRGATYRLTLASAGAGGLGFWHTTADAYAYGGLLIDGQEQPGDLVLTTLYEYRLTDALAEAWGLARREARQGPGLVLLLTLPGLVLALYGLHDQAYDLGTWLALVLALSMAAWPLLLLWASVLRLFLTGDRIWAVVAALLGLALYRTLRLSRAKRPLLLIERDQEGSGWLPQVALLAILCVTLATRLLQVRELVVPAWVDSMHHTVITQLIADAGGIPASYEPYMPVQDFHYHFGFHALAAMLMRLSGLPAHRAVLLLGQVLNAAGVLAAYLLGRWLSGRAWGGVVAALVAGALSSFPAYYVSWGRYTQLAGLLVLPATCFLAAELLRHRRSRGLWVCATWLAAGLLLTHYRVLLFYLLFWPPYLGLLLWRERGAWAAWGALLGTSLLLAGVALWASAPWVARMVVRILPQVEGVYGGWASPEGYNDFPGNLVDLGWGRALVYVSGAGALWGLLRRRGEVIFLAAWTGLWFLAANLHLLGLHDIWLLHNPAVVISLWLPESALCGWLVVDLLAWLGRGLEHLSARVRWQETMAALLLVATLALAGWGSWRMVDVLNPTTVLVSEDDLRAMAWAAENTPTDALFLINSRVWQGDLRVGSDGGWWLPLLADRRTTLPCVLYYQGPPEYVDSVRELARSVEEAASLDDPALIERLQSAGVSHVFVGARGGRLMPEDLDASPHYRLLYGSGPSRIYAFVANP
jgi:hypothetical protein